MRSILESPVQIREGFRPYSIVINETGSPITPYSTHIKVHENPESEEYFCDGHYLDKMSDALSDFRDRCKRDGIEL